MNTNKTALVLGATGGIGGEVAKALLARGWKVKALVRKLPQDAPVAGVEWLRGDAMVEDDVLRAADGVALIVHAVNPPGYRNWGELVLPMLDNSITAARSAGARILLPGTLYNYGSGSPQLLMESTPQRPSSRKGAIRIEMEQRLRAASAEGVKSLIVRAGDFFGPHAGNNWFSQGLVKPGQPVASVGYPGSPGVGHTWAYLPDLAHTMVRLVEQEAKLASFESFHFRGHWDADGTQMIDAVRAATDQPDLKAGRMPWFVLRLLAPFVALFREMVEVRYLWQEAFELDNRKLLALLGHETHTPWVGAVHATLAGLGCLPEEAALAEAI